MKKPKWKPHMKGFVFSLKVTLRLIIPNLDPGVV